jgi:pimeloyl-ACP methyl ester carboxylesterase
MTPRTPADDAGGPPDDPGAGSLDDTGLPGESRMLDVGSLRLHARVAGPEDGPLVVLLHGFPEFWYCWADYIGPLSAAGYRVVAPDGRGYNLSDRPSTVGAYRIEALADDVLGVLDALGRETGHVVGHDWGGLVAWWVGLHAPDRVDRLAVLNAPHPTVFRETFRRSVSQRFRSWYAGAFQLPTLSASVLSAADYRLLVDGLRRSSLPGTFSEEDLVRYRAAWRQPGALRAMLSYYRAAGRYGLQPDNTRVEPETLVLWGARDRFLQRSMAHESAGHCRDGRAKLLWDATHWLHHEYPAAVTDDLRSFFER